LSEAPAAFVIRTLGRRIAAIAEHYNALISLEKLIPLMAQAAEQIYRAE